MARETVALNLSGVAATQALAGRVAALAQRGDMIGLSGDLGSGKTVFARAFIRARAVRLDAAPPDQVPSPTFTLVQVYEMPEAPVWHIDLYRLEKPEEAWELGIEEAFSDGIALVEWVLSVGDPELHFVTSGSNTLRGDMMFHSGKRAMDDTEALVAIGALVLGFIPAALVGLILAAFIAIGLVVLLLAALMEKPITCWVCAGSVIFNIIVLVPLGLVAVVAMNFEQHLWDVARQYVYIFSGVFITPSLLFWYLCNKQIREEE